MTLILNISFLHFFNLTYQVAKNVVREPEEVKKAAPEKDPKVVIEHGPDRRDDEKAIKETKDAEEVVKAADANKAKVFLFWRLFYRHPPFSSLKIIVLEDVDVDVKFKMAVFCI